MTIRMVLIGGVVVMALAGAAGLYADRDAPPGCDSDEVLHGVTNILRDQFHIDGVFVNNIATTPREWLSDRRDCSAEVAAIRGNVDASEMGWREIRFHVGPGAAVTVRLEGDVPLAKPELSWWDKMLAHL